jgi:hypothetical protein
MQEHVGPQGASVRQQALTSNVGIEKRLRAEAITLVDDLFLGWQEFKSK